MASVTVAMTAEAMTPAMALYWLAMAAGGLIGIVLKDWRLCLFTLVIAGKTYTAGLGHTLVITMNVLLLLMFVASFYERITKGSKNTKH